MTNKRPYVPVQRDCYILVEMLDPGMTLLSEKYVILLRESGSMSVPAHQYRFIEESRNASLAEWARLHETCEELRQVAEVMDS